MPNTKMCIRNIKNDVLAPGLKLIMTVGAGVYCAFRSQSVGREIYQQSFYTTCTIVYIADK